DPSNIFPWYNKGRALLSLGKPQEALDAFNRCTQITISDAEVWNYKGVAFLELGKYQDALDCFKSALSINPAYDEARKNQDLAVNRGQVYTIKGSPLPTTRPVAVTTTNAEPLPIIPATTVPATPSATLEVAAAIPEQTDSGTPATTTYTPLPAWATLAAVISAALVLGIQRR
ncbi:MAG: tetratricopeptide repeat protein, partial [Methanoregula sp.]|nr:tetratricopeptide repeat protein [Methanoregula sp.]